MPRQYGYMEDCRDWPVKRLRGRFSWTKRHDLKARYARRRIRVVFDEGNTQ